MGTKDFARLLAGRPAEELLGELLVAYEKLEAANQELHVVNEELRVHNEELRTTREALETERRRYRDLFDSAPDGYLVTDLDGIILEANCVAADLLGVEQARLPEENLATYVNSSDRGVFYEHLTRLRAGEKVLRWEMRLVGHGAETMDVAVKVSVAGNGNGEPAALRWLIRDITERKRAEQQQQRLMVQVADDRQVVEELARSLVQERDLIQTVMENTATCLAYFDTDLQIRRLNLACIKAWGCVDEDLPGSIPFALHPSEPNQALFERVRDGGQPVSFQAVHLSPPGQPPGEASYWDWSLVPVKDADGRVQGLVLSMQDVSEQIRERLRIEELSARAQRQAEELETVFEAMVEGVVVYDNADHPVRANRAAREAYGPALAGPDRPAIIRLLNLRHLDGRPVALEQSPVDRALRGEVVQGDRYLFAHARGGDRIMAASAVPLHEGQRTVGAVAVWHDVTDQVRAESQREAALRAVRESEEKLRTLIEILPVDVWVLDHQGRITHLNPPMTGAMELPGLALRSESYRQSNFVRADGSPLPPAEFPIRRAVREQQVVRSVELGTVQEDGSMLWANVSAAPLPFDDWRAIAVTVDVTEQAEIKQALERRRQELEVLTAELEAYDHTVAHDLKNPLSMVVGSADLLAHALGELDDEGPRRLLYGILEGTLRMNEIVDSLLLLSSARSEEVEIRQLDMDEFVAQAQRDLAPLIARRGARIVAPGQWPAARGYGPWLRSVWTNYISNGLKYGGQPPVLDLGFWIVGAEVPACLATAGLDPETIKSAIQHPEEKIVFWLRDHGPGLTEQERARMFVPFTRLDRPEKLGHGLGLTIVRRIVERLGGEVGVESQPGQGSTFWFSLPAA